MATREEGAFKPPLLLSFSIVEVSYLTMNNLLCMAKKRDSGRGTEL